MFMILLMKKLNKEFLDDRPKSKLKTAIAFLKNFTFGLDEVSVILFGYLLGEVGS
jgi:hypothetical protein